LHKEITMSAVLEKRTQTVNDLKVTKVKEHIGALVTGIDLREPMDAALRKRLYELVVENVVLVIRGQNLNPAQQQASAEIFGELMEDQNRRYLVDGFPLISVLDNHAKDSTGAPAKVGKNSTWHTDHTNQERPPKFTILYAIHVPDKGGATSVCNSRAAYEALPQDLRDKITPMKTENTLISSARFKISNPDILKEQLASQKPPTVQPLVRTHPDTGAKAVWFHKSKTEKIIGMTPENTQEFLQQLTDLCTQPEFVYAHEYQPGDLLILDDRQSLHKAGFDYDHSQRRLLHRMLVRGDKPF
jgi:taurine dioxygenase